MLILKHLPEGQGSVGLSPGTEELVNTISVLALYLAGAVLHSPIAPSVSQRTCPIPALFYSPAKTSHMPQSCTLLLPPYSWQACAVHTGDAL